MDIGDFGASVLAEGPGVEMFHLREEPGGELCIYLMFVSHKNFLTQQPVTQALIAPSVTYFATYSKIKTRAA
jgi:hypothetical protein